MNQLQEGGNRFRQYFAGLADDFAGMELTQVGGERGDIAEQCAQQFLVVTDHLGGQSSGDGQ